MSESAWTVDAGLLSRFRRAGTEIQWRDSGKTKVSQGRSSSDVAGAARMAHLNDEEARVEMRSAADSMEITADSGPLGALVLLLEIDQRGIPGSLTQHPARELAGFDSGAIRARWSTTVHDGKGAVPLADIVALARYALA